MALRTRNPGEAATRRIVALSPQQRLTRKSIAVHDVWAIADIVALATNILGAPGSFQRKARGPRNINNLWLNLDATLARVPGLEELERATAELLNTSKSAAKAVQCRGDEIDRQLEAIRRVMSTSTTT